MRQPFLEPTPGPRRRPAKLALALAGIALLLLAGWFFWPARKAPSPPPPAPNAQPEVVRPPTRSPSNLTSAVPAAPPARAGATTSAPPVTVSGPLPTLATSAPPAATTTKAAPAPTTPPGPSVFEVQLALDRLALSPGSLDGAMGFRTRNALRAFQDRERLRPTGELDAATRRRLPAIETPHTNYVVTPADLKRLMPLGKSWLDKWHQPRLDFETVLELVAEKSHAHPDLIRRLNPDVRWDQVAAGTRLTVPNVFRPPVTDKAAFARIRLGDRTLQVFGDQTNLLAHFPCSIARRDEKRPVGELKVAMAVAQPNYTFDPANFPNSPEALRSNTKLILAPGPNNPVGVVWIGLDKEGYGIHGTPHPDQVGQPESLGCFRLANWNAEYLLQFVWVGMPVVVEP